MSIIDIADARAAPVPAFHPPEPSLARRDISLKQPVSGRGMLVTPGPHPRVLVYESGGEEKLAHALLADRGVSSIEEQYGPVKFLGEDGRQCVHWFDYRVLHETVGRIAFAYKPAAIVERQDFLAHLRLIAGQISPRIADAIVPVSEGKLPRNLVHNARLINAVRRDPASEVDAHVAAIAMDLNGATTIGELVRIAGHKSRAFRAAIRLVDLGVLVPRDRRSRLDYDTAVEPARRIGDGR